LRSAIVRGPLLSQGPPVISGAGVPAVKAQTQLARTAETAKTIMKARHNIDPRNDIIYVHV
jgi:hypothetical protein